MSPTISLLLFLIPSCFATGSGTQSPGFNGASTQSSTECLPWQGYTTLQGNGEDPGCAGSLSSLDYVKCDQASHNVSTSCLRRDSLSTARNIMLPVCILSGIACLVALIAFSCFAALTRTREAPRMEYEGKGWVALAISALYFVVLCASISFTYNCSPENAAAGITAMVFVAVASLMVALVTVGHWLGNAGGRTPAGNCAHCCHCCVACAPTVLMVIALLFVLRGTSADVLIPVSCCDGARGLRGIGCEGIRQHGGSPCGPTKDFLHCSGRGYWVSDPHCIGSDARCSELPKVQCESQFVCTWETKPSPGIGHCVCDEAKGFEGVTCSGEKYNMSCSCTDDRKQEDSCGVQKEAATCFGLAAAFHFEADDLQCSAECRDTHKLMRATHYISIGGVLNIICELVSAVLQMLVRLRVAWVVICGKGNCCQRARALVSMKSYALHWPPKNKSMRCAFHMLWVVMLVNCAVEIFLAVLMFENDLEGTLDAHKKARCFSIEADTLFNEAKDLIFSSKATIIGMLAASIVKMFSGTMEMYKSVPESMTTVTAVGAEMLDIGGAVAAYHSTQGTMAAVRKIYTTVSRLETTQEAHACVQTSQYTNIDKFYHEGGLNVRLSFFMAFGLCFIGTAVMLYLLLAKLGCCDNTVGKGRGDDKVPVDKEQGLGANPQQIPPSISEAFFVGEIVECSTDGFKWEQATVISTANDTVKVYPNAEAAVIMSNYLFVRKVQNHWVCVNGTDLEIGRLVI